MAIEEFSPGFVLYTGNMFGGKTAHAILDCQRAETAEKQVQAFRIGWDDRYGEDYITANNGQLRYPATISKDFDDLIKKLSTHTDLIFIDELQFWDDRILDFIRETHTHKRILATALQRDYRGNPFPLRTKDNKEIDSKKTIGDAMALSTSLSQFWPICDFIQQSKKCSCAAYFPQRRKENGKLSNYSDITIQVGGKNSYVPVCEKHFIRPIEGDLFKLCSGQVLTDENQAYKYLLNKHI